MKIHSSFRLRPAQTCSSVERSRGRIEHPHARSSHDTQNYSCRPNDGRRVALSRLLAPSWAVPRSRDVQRSLLHSDQRLQPLIASPFTRTTLPPEPNRSARPAGFAHSQSVRQSCECIHLPALAAPFSSPAFAPFCPSRTLDVATRFDGTATERRPPRNGFSRMLPKDRNRAITRPPPYGPEGVSP